MAENFSFDVVSDFDRQELVNALDQVKREISQRYDLKGTDTSLELEKENIFILFVYLCFFGCCFPQYCLEPQQWLDNFRSYGRQCCSR